METTGQEAIRRFSRTRIAEHALLIVTVGLLALTGLSQKFHYVGAAQWLILKLGGIDNVRIIHRLAGGAFLVQMTLHVAAAIVGVAVKRWRPSMMITRKDFSDAVHNIRYYAGLESRPALCDRYDYKQKFMYWGILTGGLLMIATGLVLWFPTVAARYLPGEIIPVAKALHTNEALLIFLMLAIWHIYDSIFSPDVFPLDTSIFTGYISRKRMAREHPLELARIDGVSVQQVLRHANSASREAERTLPAPPAA
jgi:cytochrome b subunit of formate dehydrogenase